MGDVPWGTYASTVDPMDNAQRTAELRQRIEELRARMPKHSVPAAMMLELDELEDELEQLQRDQPTQQ